MTGRSDGEFYWPDEPIVKVPEPLDPRVREMLDAMADTYSDGFWVGSPMQKWAAKYRQEQQR